MSRFNLSALAVSNPAVTLFLIIAVLLSGAFAFSNLDPNPTSYVSGAPKCFVKNGRVFLFDHA